MNPAVGVRTVITTTLGDPQPESSFRYWGARPYPFSLCPAHAHGLLWIMATIPLSDRGRKKGFRGSLLLLSEAPACSFPLWLLLLSPPLTDPNILLSGRGRLRLFTRASACSTVLEFMLTVMLLLLLLLSPSPFSSASHLNSGPCRIKPYEFHNLRRHIGAHDLPPNH